MTKTEKVGLTVVLFVIASLSFADEWPFLRFHGDARFSGGPVFGYRIKMRRIPLNQPGEYIFRFRGMPDENMTLELYAQGVAYDNRQELANVNTTIDALLVDQGNRVICRASGMPREGANDHVWGLMSSDGETALGNLNCAGMPLKSSASYTLTLRIRNVDPSTPKIDFVPVFEGGQVEWI